MTDFLNLLGKGDVKEILYSNSEKKKTGTKQKKDYKGDSLNERGAIADNHNHVPVI